MNQQLVDYVQQARAAGMTDEEIKKNLLTAGWQESDVNEGLDINAVSAPMAQSSGISHAVEEPAMMPTTGAPSITEMAVATTKAPWHKKINFKATGIAVAAIVILGVGGYFLYAKAFNTPEKVWTKFDINSILNQSQVANHFISKVTYTDKLQDQDFSGEVDTTTDYDTKKAQEASNTTMSVSYKYGGAKFSFDDLQVRTIGQVAYINIKNVPFVGDMAKDYDGWVKFDLNQYKQETAALGNPIDQFKDAFNKISNNSNIISGHKYLGTETIEGVSTYHYSLTVDKSALIKNVNTFVDSDAFKNLAGADPTNLDQSRQDAKKSLSDFINGMDVQTAEVWIGKSDTMIHKYIFAVKMPSIIGAAFGEAQGKASDAKVLADARQISTAAELYRYDKKVYPNNLSQLVPTYIGAMPTPPTDNRGNCAGKDGYNYNLLNKDTYKLTFCLSGSMSGYQPGILAMDQTGFITNIEAHPEWNDAISPEQPKVATLALESTFSNHSGTVQVVAPDKAYDLSNTLNSAQSSSRDAQRLANIRQMATALELFYNDAGGYPPSSNGLPVDSGSIKFSTYANTIPTAPTPPDGACSLTQNDFVYTASGKGYTGTGGASAVYPSYTYTFCLGSTTGGLAAGMHTASPSGIQ